MKALLFTVLRIGVALVALLIPTILVELVLTSILIRRRHMPSVRLRDPERECSSIFCYVHANARRSGTHRPLPPLPIRLKSSLKQVSIPNPSAKLSILPMSCVCGTWALHNTSSHRCVIDRTMIQNGEIALTA